MPRRDGYRHPDVGLRKGLSALARVVLDLVAASSFVACPDREVCPPIRLSILLAVVVMSTLYSPFFRLLMSVYVFDPDY